MTVVNIKQVFISISQNETLNVRIGMWGEAMFGSSSMAGSATTNANLDATSKNIRSI